MSKVFLPRLAEGKLISFEGKNKLHPQKGSARVIGHFVTIPLFSNLKLDFCTCCFDLKAKTFDFTDLKTEFEKKLREGLLF